MNTRLIIAQVIGWLARISGGLVWLVVLLIFVAAISDGSHPPRSAWFFVSLIVLGYPLACWRPTWGGALMSASVVWLNIIQYQYDGSLLPIRFSRPNTGFIYLILVIGLLFIAQGLIRRVHRRGPGVDLLASTGPPAAN
ncbi:MAG: hypothetical protein FWC56_01280 [Phycisphaerae bacterium]|nr:hypothetical protein [Phycisphaerae bacterium]